MESEILRAFLRKEGLGVKPSPSCPDETELAEYLEETLSQDKHRIVCEHIISCESCFRKVAEAESAFFSFSEENAEHPPVHIQRKAKMTAKRPGKTTKMKNHFRKNKFLYLSIIFLIFSFISKRYFAQFLAIAIISGFKWVMDTGGSKALIMIYEAWKTSHRNR